MARFKSIASPENPNGTMFLMTPEEETQRDLDEAAHVAAVANPPVQRDLLAEIDALKTKMTAAEAEIEQLKAPK